MRPCRVHARASLIICERWVWWLPGEWQNQENSRITNPLLTFHRISNIANVNPLALGKQVNGMGATLNQSVTQLSSRERLLLLLPLAGSAFVGLFLLFLPTLLATLTGYEGNDLYIYRLTGAATLGYPIALGLALRQGSWASTRLVVVAFFTFGIASLYACAVDIIVGRAHSVVYVVLLLTLIFVAITGTLLYTHRGEGRAVADIASWVVWLLVIATILATVFGLLPLLFPYQFGHIAGFKATDLFVYEQAGAATLGYAVMGMFELRSRNWLEIRWPLVMAAVFNGLSFLASVLAIVSGDPPLLPYLVAPVSLGVTVAIIVALRRGGK